MFHFERGISGWVGGGSGGRGRHLPLESLGWEYASMRSVICFLHMDRSWCSFNQSHTIRIKVLDDSNPFWKLWIKLETFNQIHLDVQVKLTIWAKAFISLRSLILKSIFYYHYKREKALRMCLHIVLGQGNFCFICGSQIHLIKSLEISFRYLLQKNIQLGSLK